MVKNPSFPQPNLHSVDKLFINSILLPLHLPSHHSNPLDSEPKANAEEMHTLEPESEPGPRPESATLLSKSPLRQSVASFTTTNNHEDKDKDKKKERKSSSGANAVELNINIWPFSRSCSAGNSDNRPKMVAGGAASRKVSSGPCPRSNSAGEYKFRKWPSSLVWKVQRGDSNARSSEPLAWNADKGVKKEGLESRQSMNVGGSGARARVLNLNVPMCIGYHFHLSCKNDVSSTIGNGCSHEQGHGVASSRSSTFCSLRDGDDDNLRTSSVF
uniref:Uncharacterized protein n=1 Tax=Nelumbo nucifera TaxID=4432 RepID=A0A822YAS4_NELNU|nr:TPA_asm: hypothetical protein HUJ06_031138 [Nelumbo nucifera]